MNEKYSKRAKEIGNEAHIFITNSINENPSLKYSRALANFICYKLAELEDKGTTIAPEVNESERKFTKSEMIHLAASTLGEGRVGISGSSTAVAEYMFDKYYGKKPKT